MARENFKKWMQFIPVTIGIIYCWYGFQKFIPGLSMYEELAKQTIGYITMGMIPSEISILLLAILECSIGFMLIFYDRPKYTLVVALLHIICTFLPLLFIGGLHAEITAGYWLQSFLIIGGLVIIFPHKKQVHSAGMEVYHQAGMRPS